MSDLLIGILAVWRLTHLLHAEEGPFGLGTRLRRRLGAAGFNGLLDCFYCLSLLVSALAAPLLASGWRDGCALWLALSGGAILLQRLTVPEARYQEDP